MAADEGQERTETATPKKREDARRKGQVCQSREVSAAVTLLFAVGFFYFFTPALMRDLLAVTAELFRTCAQVEMSSPALVALLVRLLVQMGVVLAPFFAAALVVAVGANVAQFGFNYAPEAVMPRLEKLNVVRGFLNLFKVGRLIELLKSVGKVGIVGYVAYTALRSEWERFVPIMELSPRDILLFTGRLTFVIALRVALAMLVLAALDYIWQRHEYEKSLRMTRQEVKDEFKQREGDPLVRGRIRRMQIELAQRRMMEAVPKADVVITNPTEIAVAVRYEARKMVAPQVVAKGRGLVAQKIREIALRHGVPVLERPPLARALYKMVKIGRTIPESLYQAIAEVLAYVYRLKKRAI